MRFLSAVLGTLSSSKVYKKLSTVIGFRRFSLSFRVKIIFFSSKLRLSFLVLKACFFNTSKIVGFVDDYITKKNQCCNQTSSETFYYIKLIRLSFRLLQQKRKVFKMLSGYFTFLCVRGHSQRKKPVTKTLFRYYKENQRKVSVIYWSFEMIRGDMNQFFVVFSTRTH